MAEQTPAPHSPLTDAVCRRIQAQAGKDAPLIERLARRFYRDLEEEGLGSRGELDLYGAVLGVWACLRRRKPAVPLIRVFNPVLEDDGWECTHTVVQILNDNMPFLLDSVLAELQRRGLHIHVVLHPVLPVRRNAKGEFTGFGEKGDGGARESLIHAEVDRISGREERDALAADLGRILGEVRAAVTDWKAMRERMAACIATAEEGIPGLDREELGEDVELLRWVLEDHFVFLGYREYALERSGGEDVLRVKTGSSLGILRQTEGEKVSQSFALLPADLRSIAREKRLLVLNKTNARSTVHRAVHMDYLGVRCFDEQGEVCGEHRFIGLLTAAAYNRSPRRIPILRRRVQRILDRAGLEPDSHDGKALVQILETYPRDDLFQASEDELFHAVMRILHLQERPRTRLFIRRDAFGRFFSCLVFVPREAYNTDLRVRIQNILYKALEGVSVEFTAQLSEGPLARISFAIRTRPDARPEFDTSELEARIAAAARGWREDLLAAFTEHFGEERGARLFARWGNSFPAAYREDSTAPVAAHDVERMEALAGPDDLGMCLYHPVDAPTGSVRFKLLRRDRHVTLSDVMPMLENMGVRVLFEHPYKLATTDGAQYWIHNFGLGLTGDEELPDEATRANFQEVFGCVWRGERENDGFNRLALAGMGARSIAVLRALSKFLRQAQFPFSQAYMERAVTRHPAIARMLWDLFRARLDPGQPDRQEQEAHIVAALEAALEKVESLDEDRILRRLMGAIRAVLRTNYYRKGDDGRPRPYLAFKLDPARIPEVPLPLPKFEIFVHSPRVEGVHLRGGAVARGGLRWSDRLEDFRTEVLGLMKAQMVKNAVIVPVGAKGGFVVKRPPAEGGREALQAEVVECYRTFIRGLLDVTDNLSGGEVVPPPDTVRHDGDDPYLVVAADKGTAAFSDIANGVAEEYGFWLGDAFASGGSAGYDHKKMGITARGGWESVKRHLREIGIDPQAQEFTVAGIGDMSGDVFGNGMLLSEHIRLVAAFDHRHIFLDPEPDAARSFAERQRLFALPRSTWEDYDASLISPGGGVFPRSAKSIALTPEVRKRLDVQDERLAPNELIRAILKAPVDLLWNGGIGTYVKAEEERHAEVGDKANDGLRVNGGELRARVVGEGGNLGLTQLGRIEFARAGGRVNTDFIDNSGGVDCSDHEVNLKILLNEVVAAGDLTRKQRDRLLVEMTDAVAAAVLADNYAQAQAISLTARAAPALFDEHVRFIRALEKAGFLNRALERLPDDEEIAERQTRREGLTRPEIAVLLAYAKIQLFQNMIQSKLPDEPYVERNWVSYFPPVVPKRFPDVLARHRLRREIAATALTNELINRMGPTFVYRIQWETGGKLSDVARAWCAAREAFALDGVWEDIEGLDGQVEAAVQQAMLVATLRLVEGATRWVLRNRPAPISIDAEVQRVKPQLATLVAVLPRLLGEGDRAALRKRDQDLRDAGVPRALAMRVARCESLGPALDIVEIAAEQGGEVRAVAGLYWETGARLDLPWLRDQILLLPESGPWEQLGRSAFRTDFFVQQRELCAAVLRGKHEGEPEAQVDAWLEKNRTAAARWFQLVADAKAASVRDFAVLGVLLRELRYLARHDGG